MADTERFPLQHQSGWVDLKKRWSYGDRRLILDADPPIGRAMFYHLVVAWDRGATPTPADLDTLDDQDVERIIERLVQLRTEQVGDLNDPNALRASSQTSPEERSGPSTDGSSEPNSASI